MSEISTDILNKNLNDEVSYNDFFSALGYGVKDTIYLRQFHDPKETDESRNREVSFSHFEAILPALRVLESRKWGTFFVVNGGGQNDKQVKAAKVARAQFAEMDDFDFEEQIRRINAFPLEPSVIIKTKKSLHCYWLLIDGDIKRFRDIQIRLAQYFDGDPTIKNESRVMRLYGFLHQKSDPVTVTLIKFDPELRYTQDRLSEVLPEIVQEKRQHRGSSGNTSEKVTKGDRNNFLYRKACSLQARGFPDSAIEAAILVVNKECNDPPLSDEEAKRTVKSALTRDKGNLILRKHQLTDDPDRLREILQDDSEEEQKVYTREDFTSGIEPFMEVYKHKDNPFRHQQALERMAETAKLCKVTNFKALYTNFCASVKAAADGPEENTSDFIDQPFALSTGRWLADETGVMKPGFLTENEVACPHPIMPVQRLVNVDTGIEKLKIAFKRSGRWRSGVYDRKTLASSNLIVGLADYGISVTSETAKSLVQYLYDVENLNYDLIPEAVSAARLGWIRGKGFSPYVDGLVYDGNESFARFYDSVSQKGSLDEWIEYVKKIRAKTNVSVKAALAAAFASVLVEPCSCLPFFVHIWGNTGNGKTVTLMLAASVWADPHVGEYIHTFNSTEVGLELSAGFVNSLPLILDELQIQKDRQSFDKTIYKLSEGVGRTRGAKQGGVRATSTWRNCIITSGEAPITTSRSGAGAMNRIIEVEAREQKMFDDPAGVAGFIQGHYGTGGRAFIDILTKDKYTVLKEAQEMQRSFFKELSADDITDKQAMAASVLLTADTLIEEHLFQDGNGLEVGELRKCLATNREVSIHRRALIWLEGWIMEKYAYFDDVILRTDCYGKRNGKEFWIIKNIFENACREAGFDPKSFMTFLRDNGYTRTDPGALTMRQRMSYGSKVQCVVFIPDDQDGQLKIDINGAEEEEPF